MSSQEVDICDMWVMGANLECVGVNLNYAIDTIVLPTLRIKNAYNYTKIYATETIELPALALYFVTCSFTFACVFLRLGYIF